MSIGRQSRAIAKGSAKHRLPCALLAHSLLALPLGATELQPGMRWDWQLTRPVDFTRDVAIFDIHPDEISPAELAELEARGIFTICYVSVGTLENDSSDINAFPAHVIGKTYDNWPNERFLDIRRIKVLIPIMKKRFEACKTQGFSAIEPDNMDVFENDSGFNLSEDDGIRYFKALAKLAHDMGLAIGQKNASQLASKLEPVSDFIIMESCFKYGFCEDAKSYVSAGKPALDAEYHDHKIDFSAACEEAERLEISMILKDRDLTKNYQTCH